MSDITGRKVTAQMDLGAAFIAKDGRPIIPAYTVQSVKDEIIDFTYWLVNLHDFTVGQDVKFNIRLFHDQASAEEFAMSRRRKTQ